MASLLARFNNANAAAKQPQKALTNIQQTVVSNKGHDVVALVVTDRSSPWSKNGKSGTTRTLGCVVAEEFSPQILPESVGYIEDGVLHLKREVSTPMTPEDIADFQAKLTEEKVPKTDGRWRRTNRIEIDGEETLSFGSMFQHSVFKDNEFSHGNRRLGVGDVVVFSGLRPKRSNGYLSWEKTSVCAASAELTASISKEKLFQSIEYRTELPNMNPKHGYGEQNVLPDEMEEYKSLLNVVAKSVKETSPEPFIMRLPPHQRKAAKKSLLIPLYRPEIPLDPARVTACDNPVLMSVPTYDKSFHKYSDFDKTSKKETLLEIRAQHLLNDLVCVIQVKFWENHMEKFGIVDFDRYANLISIYAPLCSGYIFGSISVVESAHMPQNNIAMDSAGLGDCGVVVRCNTLQVDVASGVMRSGYEITAGTAREFCQLALGPNLTRDPEIVKKNTLKDECLNLFECEATFESLQGKYRYFVLLAGEKPAYDKRISATLQKIREECSSDEAERSYAEEISILLTEDWEGHQAEESKFSNDFQIRLAEDPDLSKFCVFAVRKDVAEKIENPVVQSDEERQQLAQEMQDLIDAHQADRIEAQARAKKEAEVQAAERKARREKEKVDEAVAAKQAREVKKREAPTADLASESSASHAPTDEQASKRQKTSQSEADDEDLPNAAPPLDAALAY